MDFFSAQHDARRRTRLLIGLFLMSLICLLAMANLLLYLVFSADPLEPSFYIAISVSILLIVLFSSLFKSLSLRQGGEAVAQMLNARLLSSPSNHAEQRLLNVVEEMAIASGTPVPPVYIMEESAINAFAAGHSINDAVIGITRGAIDKLDRDELQGVIAHEFSHVLHGDMRLNLRLIAWLHGIMVLGIIGQYMLRAASASRRGNNNNAGFAAVGIGLIVLGASGSFFGSLIKAAVSRQREYLADASAVQYTRNPQGITGALKRIAVDSSSPILSNPASSQISHALFSEGVKLHFSSLFATHPPLEKRIRALDPDWNGDYEARELHEFSNNPSELPAQPPELPPLAIALAIARAGAPDDIDVSNARAIHGTIPDVCLAVAHNTLGAAAMICLLLMQEELTQLRSPTLAPDQVEQIFSSRLPTEIHQALMAEIYRLLPAILTLESQHRLPLINICLGTLRQLSLEQYQQWRSTLSGIMALDKSPDLGGWIIFQLTIQHLDRAFGLTSSASMSGQGTLGGCMQELGVFLSVLSLGGHAGDKAAQTAFSAASNYLGMTELKFMSAQNIRLDAFYASTERLAKLNDADKKRLLQASSVCVYHDQKLTATENELLKMTSELLGWPLPSRIFR